MKRSRMAGVTLPLFSIRSERDWGIGEITDLAPCAAFFRRAGHTLLQILPPHELAGGETSPYGARTAFGIDPIYVGLDAVPDFDAEARSSVLGAAGGEGERELARLRAAARVDYRGVRALKSRALRAAFERFKAREYTRGTERARELDRFIAAERDWLRDLALYTVIREMRDDHGWETWPEEERERAPNVLEQIQKTHADRLLEIAYVQWIALAQWAAARDAMRALEVELMGDLPFVVCGESADVWSRASQFQRHSSLGAPPDDFSADGQDWGLPSYDWLSMEGDDLAWVRARTHHAVRLYDRFRLDHVVGYFRQWVKAREHGAKGRFDPSGTDAQRARGRRVLGAIVEEAGEAKVIAEDLGVIPPFVRETLAELKTPGYRVIPWEREHGHFRDPKGFPARSVATWSTHDTAPITAWWSEFTDHERAALARIAGIADSANDERVREDERSLALLRLLFGAGSDLTLVLAQELFGEKDRINTPATVGEENWTYRMKRSLEDLGRDRWIDARFDAVRRAVEHAGRFG